MPLFPLLQVTIEPCGPGHENDPGCGTCGPGECLGSGGTPGSGPFTRNIRLSAWDMDRETGFAGATQLSDILISCVNDNFNFPLDIGLDIASDGRIFMASPDTDKLLVFATDPTTGAVSATSPQSVPLGWSPCGVEVGQGVDSQNFSTEVAIVIGTDHAAAEKGKIRIFQDLSNFATFTIGEVTGLGTAPVSATIRENGLTVFVAHEGAGEVRANSIQDGTEIVDPQDMQLLALPVSGTLRRVVIQRSTP